MALDFIDEEMLTFFKAREDVGSAVRQKGLLGNEKNSWKVSVVYDRREAQEMIKDYLMKHPE